MPTNHRRYAITETNDIRNALEIARRRWPDLADKPGALLRRLVLVGRDTLAHDHRVTYHERQQAVEETSGALAGVFGPDYLKELRADWAE